MLDNSKPVASILSVVTLTFKSLPVIVKASLIKLIFPSVSPNLNSPEDEKNIPFPDVSVGFVPSFNVPTDESISKLSVSNINDGAAISTAEPDINAADAVICPVCFSLKLLLDDFISEVSISKLAIVPAVFAVIVVAVIAPVIFAAEAVICPDDFNIKFEDASFICVDETENPAILDAPWIKAEDAVISPVLLNINFELDDDIAAESILKPAIVPAVFAIILLAVISPVIFAADAVISPEAFILKLDDDMKNSFPVADPLIKNPAPRNALSST